MVVYSVIVEVVIFDSMVDEELKSFVESVELVNSNFW